MIKRLIGDKFKVLSKGFSILEVLIALLIFVVGVVGITKAFNTGLFASTDSENVNLALNIAQAKMEEIKNTPFEDLSDSGPTTDINFTNFSLSVNVAEGQNPMQVDVSVAWSVKGQPVDITLTTLLASYE